METEIENLKDIFENVKAELDKKNDSSIKKTKSKIQKIKDICSSYFEHYDKELKTMET
jgi:hypothetical protein